VQGPVRSGVVVVGQERIQLGLQRRQGGGWWAGGEVFLQGLVEAFDLAAGLWVMGPGVGGVDAAGVQGDLEGYASAAAGCAGEHCAVVGEQAGRIAVAGSAIAEDRVDASAIASLYSAATAMPESTKSAPTGARQPRTQPC
jgi:hypothetical protein